MTIGLLQFQQEDEDLITSLSTNSSEVDVLQEQIRELHSELWQSYDKCDTVKGELRKRDDTLKKKMSELTELTTKVEQEYDTEISVCWYFSNSIDLPIIKNAHCIFCALFYCPFSLSLCHFVPLPFTVSFLKKDWFVFMVY